MVSEFVVAAAVRFTPTMMTTKTPGEAMIGTRAVAAAAETAAAAVSREARRQRHAT